jgi:hypothetical protein
MKEIKSFLMLRTVIVCFLLFESNLLFSQLYPELPKLKGDVKNDRKRFGISCTDTVYAKELMK